MERKTFGMFCAFCIMLATLAHETNAEVQTHIRTAVQFSNTTMQAACELENGRLYDDVFTADNNVRYYKITVKRMSVFEFNVNSDAKGQARLLDSKGEKIIGWQLRGKNQGFTYEDDDPTYLLWDDYGHKEGEEELLDTGTYYVEIVADKKQFTSQTEEIRFHAMGCVTELNTYIKLNKVNAVYTGKEIALPKVKVTWVIGNEKYTYDENGKRHRIKYNCIMDRRTGKEIKVIKKIGSYLICNRGFIDDGVNTSGASCAVFTVTPQKGVLKEAKSKKAGQIQAIAKKNTAAGRYQLQVSTDKKFKTNVQTVNTKETKQTVKNLESGKRYYVRVRYYKNVPIKYIHGMGKPQPIYGKWSKAKTVVCK